MILNAKANRQFRRAERGSRKTAGILRFLIPRCLLQEGGTDEDSPRSRLGSYLTRRLHKPRWWARSSTAKSIPQDHVEAAHPHVVACAVVERRGVIATVIADFRADKKVLVEPMRPAEGVAGVVA